VFDEADVIRRASELGDFIAGAREQHGLSAPVAVGFSNGANIAAALLMLRPGALAGAVLIRAMVPLSQPPAVDLAGKPVLILSGAIDPTVSADNAGRLAAQLRNAGADVQHRMLPAGHGLSQADIALARDFMTHASAAIVSAA
jgi:phospholipase/carboxylesterase